MKNDVLLTLRIRYNKCLERNRKAEYYLKTHTVKECLGSIKKKNGEEIIILDVFNEVVRDLSNLIIEIEKVMGKNMTTYERLNGFKLGG